ncbi:MAG: hypothetical protein D6698_17635, partial [Gammaproteobacteria bacterium]
GQHQQVLLRGRDRLALTLVQPVEYVGDIHGAILSKGTTQVAWSLPFARICSFIKTRSVILHGILPRLLLIAALLPASPLSAEPVLFDSLLEQRLDRAPATIRDYLAACILARIPLDEVAETALVSTVPDSAIKRLQHSHILYRHQLISRQAFIRSASRFKRWKELMPLHEQSGYPFGILPPIVQDLADLALRERAALAPLVQAFSATDGSYRADLLERLQAIYNRHPEWQAGTETGINNN